MLGDVCRDLSAGGTCSGLAERKADLVSFSTENILLLPGWTPQSSGSPCGPPGLTLRTLLQAAAPRVRCVCSC